MSNYANYLPSSSINAFRRCSPTKHVWHVPRTRLSLEANIGTCLRLQCANGTIDGVVFELLKRFYPQREITVTSPDPPYVTLAIKTQEPFNVSGQFVIRRLGLAMINMYTKFEVSSSSNINSA